MGRGLTGLQLCRFLTCRMCGLQLASPCCPLHPPTAACATQEALRDECFKTGGEVLQNIIRHQKAQKRQTAFSSFCITLERTHTHTQLQNSCQWEETCVGCLCISLSRAASFRFCASRNSLIYGWTQAGSERITSLALSHSCGKVETCEPFPLLFIIICIVSIFILLLIYLAV